MKKTAMRRYQNAGIQAKMTAASLLVTMIPMLILEGLFFLLIQRATLREFRGSAEVYVRQLEENYAAELDKLEHLAGTLADFRLLETYLTTDFPSAADAFHYYQQNIHPILKNCNSAYEGVRVRVYHGNQRLGNFSFELSNRLDDLLHSGALSPAQLGSEGGWVRADMRYNTYRPAYSYFRAVRQSESPYGLAYVISLHMDENSFYTQIAGQPEESALVFVLDRQGTVLTANQRDAVGLCLEDLGLVVPENWERVSCGGGTYVPVYAETRDFSILYLLSYDGVLQEMRWSMQILLMSGLLLLVISYLLIARISQRIAAGLQSLNRRMQNVDRESILSIATSKPGGGGDEVAQLEAVFIAMMARIDRLIETAADREQSLKDAVIARQKAEIQALQHQIDPHYLFNTLEALRMNLVIRGDRENAEIVKLFSEGFRRYIDMDREYVTLYEEVEFIHKYIRIQNYRLNNKIQFDTAVEGNVLGFRVLKLLLQPLVENAVCHGLEAKEGVGRILLTIRREGEVLRILVEDDGVGMPPERLEALRRSIRGAQPEKSVALHNVCDRIRLAYGESASLDIHSAPGQGTRITLLLPIRLLEERK
ncbi:MAG: sensor histidine kinase [Oscillospiraceae bacterium]|nr:sensor histidine kinase [Oscillospiraceae bacterium]